MAIVKLDILSVRNIHRATLLPSPSLNLITGANASGKSSLLEAIFILGRARSFRTANIKQAIEFEQPDLIVSAQIQQTGGHLAQLGIQINQKHCDIHINRESKKKSDLAYSLPLQLIHPKSYKLLDAGPQIRREFMDWGIFNHKQNFLSDWRNFKKVLLQRNSLLKSRQLKQLGVWNGKLVQYSELVTTYRQDYLRLLEPVFQQVAEHFLTNVQLQLKFLPGYDREKGLLHLLQGDLEKDLRYGYTHSGPHRSDFQLLFNQRIAKDFVSRGQLKLLVLALKLAQVKLLNQFNNNSVCILIDDLTAELDTLNKAKLLKYLAGLNCQVFMSSTELSDFGELNDSIDLKVFHVEHGCIKSL
ncbi:DNA replication/repair protein RecF [Methylomarinum vadi]|uniref:DNA replication/repair protein RecF n=1 Tax=Methylomarinum vadi TaxID=438855 RepID=UPI0004DF16CE|nr:DNA replication/repair protein RecF [Methylomarinum vadi]